VFVFPLECFDCEIVFENNSEIETCVPGSHGQGIAKRLVRCSSFHPGLRPYFFILRMREL